MEQNFELQFVEGTDDLYSGLGISEERKNELLKQTDEADEDLLGVTKEGKKITVFFDPLKLIKKYSALAKSEQELHFLLVVAGKQCGRMEQRAEVVKKALVGAFSFLNR